MSERIAKSVGTPPEAVALDVLLAETDDAQVLQALQQLDKSADGTLDYTEVDADQNHRIDTMMEILPHLPSQKFGTLESILNKHGFRITSVMPEEMLAKVPAVSDDPKSAVKRLEIAHAVDWKELRSYNVSDNPSVTPPAVLREYLAATKNTTVPFVPEFEYKTFYFSLAQGVPELIDEQCRLAKLILEASPKTEVYLTAAEGVAGDFGIPEALRNRLHVIPQKVIQDPWAQDFGEAIGGASKRYVVGWLSRGRTVDFAAGEMAVAQTEVPFVLEGGNVTKTVLNDSKILVVGDEDIARTVVLYQRDYGYDISPKEVERLYQETFGADRVMVLQNSDRAFHIDQMALFPAADQVIMPKLVYSDELMARDPSLVEYQLALENNKRGLSAAGFDVIEIPMAWDMVEKNQALTNSIVVTAAGKTHIIMPSFGESELEDETRRILESKGFAVSFSENTTYMKMGNSHCLTGVLAANDGLTKKDSV